MNVLVYVVAWTGTCMHALKYLKEVIQSYSRTVADWCLHVWNFGYIVGVHTCIYMI